MDQRDQKNDKVVNLPYPKRFIAKSDKEIIEAYMRLSVGTKHAGEATYLVSEELGCSNKRVQEVVRKAQLREHAKEQRQELAIELYKEKIPLAEKVVGLSLKGLEEYLQNLLANPEKLLAMTPKDVSSLAAIATRLNELLRLELGKSTQNISVQVAQHSYEATIQALSKLRSIDPVFEYPELPALDLQDELP